MSIRTALFDWLTADETLSGLVGDRIYPLRGPQMDPNTVPDDSILRARVGESEDDLLLGNVAFRKPRLAFLCCSVDYDKADDISEALRARMRGLIYPQKQIVNDIQFENLVLRECRDDPRFLEANIFTVYVEYEVHYQ